MQGLSTLVNDAPYHAVLRDDGRVSLVRVRVTPSLLARHERGETTILGPDVGDEGTARFISIEDVPGAGWVNTIEQHRSDIRRWVPIQQRLSELLPDRCTASFWTGEGGCRSFVSIDDEEVDEASAVAEGLRAMLGVTSQRSPSELDAHPQAPADERARVNGFVLLPGFIPKYRRWSRLMRPRDGVCRTTPIENVDSLGIEPLSRREFRRLFEWAWQNRDSTRAWQGSEPSPSDLKVLVPEFGSILRFCPAVQEALNTLAAGSFVSARSLQRTLRFLASLSDRIPGARDAVARMLPDDETVGYWNLWANCADYPMSCTRAQDCGVCRSDCSSRILTGVRTPLNFRNLDEDFVNHRIQSERPLTLEDARREQAERFLAAVGKHLSEPSVRIV